MARIDVKVDIITNDYGWIYELFEWDCIYPKKVMDIIEASAPDEPLDVYINSGGGLVSAGQEIYSTLLSHKQRVNIHIEGLAASAASIIAMAGPSEISPVGMVMIHNVSGGAQGDYHAMEKSAEVLKQYNTALCTAYCVKTGKKLDDMLKLMDRETWLTAEQAVRMGFVDKIMETKPEQMVASEFGIRLTQADIERAMDIKAKREAKANEDRSRKESIMSDLDKYGV